MNIILRIIYEEIIITIFIFIHKAMSKIPNRFLLPELENKSFRDTKQI